MEPSFDKQKIQVRDTAQILGMGGPWLGDLFYEDKLVSKDVIADNLLFNLEDNRLFYVRYHRLSRWANNNFFTINFLDIKSFNTYQTLSNYPMAYVNEIINDELIFHEAFHPDIPDNKRVLDINSVKFKSLGDISNLP